MLCQFNVDHLCSCFCISFERSFEFLVRNKIAMLFHILSSSRRAIIDWQIGLDNEDVQDVLTSKIQFALIVIESL